MGTNQNLKNPMDVWYVVLFAYLQLEVKYDFKTLEAVLGAGLPVAFLISLALLIILTER